MKLRVEKSAFLLVFLLSLFTGYSQANDKRISRTEYIDMYKDEAIREMKEYGIPASITLAQGILESGDGNSVLARKANNHFGIKCHSDWTGKKYFKDDDEKDECFRVYESALGSFRDHSEFLKKKRYAFLFELKITDYKGWANGLKKAGYATNPKYPQLLIDIIERNQLYQYDRVSIAEAKDKRDKRKKSESAKKSNLKTKVLDSYKVKTHQNNIKYIEVEAGTSINKLADELNMGPWQLYKYNDLSKGEKRFKEGVVFLQPKRSRAKEDFHTAVEGETMWSISQQYGVKLKKLYKLNRMSIGDPVSPGQQLYLRSKKPH